VKPLLVEILSLGKNFLLEEVAFAGKNRKVKPLLKGGNVCFVTKSIFENKSSA
jgi:hypothetical protein